VTSRRISGTRAAWAAAVVLAVIVGSALIVPLFGSLDPTVSGNLETERFQAPSASHLLGTDAIARDVLARILHGTRVSLEVALIAVGVAALLGIAWGTLAALAEGAVERWMMRLVDALLATPRLLIILALVAFTGRLGPAALGLVLGVTGWAPMSRIVRAKVRELRVRDYVSAARALGMSRTGIVFRHILPGIAPPALVNATLAFAAAIPLEAALGYIGAGVAPPTPSWGVLLRDASDRPLDAWWLLLFPSLAIAATVLSVNLIGERLQRREGAKAA
jgi:peptide/nickel transport system permease protein